MRTDMASSVDLSSGDLRLDASYHASQGLHAAKALVRSGKMLERLDQICLQGGVFIPGRFKRIFVDDPKHGAPYLTGGSIMQANPQQGVKLLSYRYTANLDKLSLNERMILITCSGEIGNTVYVNANFKGAVGSPDLIRVLVDPRKVLSGYLYAYLSSTLAHELIRQKTYGAVISHIEAHHVFDLPIPRLGDELEAHIHQLIEQAAELRVEANQHLQQTQERFYREVLRIDPDSLIWRYRNEHALAAGTTEFSHLNHRLDGFHHVGYVDEAKRFLEKTVPLGDLVEPYQPPMFKRPYTDETGIPFLSGMDLYNYYPKPHMYISRKMANLDLYMVRAGTILVQNVGQRYGLFGRPTILPNHLDQCAVTQHLMRVYSKDVLDRGFVYIWLLSEVGRRTLLKQSFGTSMGVLFERSFKEMPVPECAKDLRHSFESDVHSVCQKRERANELEDQAQAIIALSLGLTKNI